MIKVINSDDQLSEEKLNEIEENEGLTLISVNSAPYRRSSTYKVGHERHESISKGIGWVYHFRAAGKKSFKLIKKEEDSIFLGRNGRRGRL